MDYLLKIIVHFVFDTLATPFMRIKQQINRHFWHKNITTLSKAVGINSTRAPDALSQSLSMCANPRIANGYILLYIISRLVPPPRGLVAKMTHR